MPVDARLIAATNRDLEEEVAAGRFREDLYYRLNVVRIHLPPLRERLEDLPLLAGHILTRLNRAMGRQIEGLSPAALQVLGGYRFPGNVRELENILERAVIFAEGTSIGPEDLDLGAAQPGPAGTAPAEPSRPPGHAQGAGTTPHRRPPWRAGKATARAPPMSSASPAVPCSTSCASSASAEWRSNERGPPRRATRVDQPV